jgi:predicted ATP-binding protein involved in virulence
VVLQPKNKVKEKTDREEMMEKFFEAKNCKMHETGKKLISIRDSDEHERRMRVQEGRPQRL